MPRSPSRRRLLMGLAAFYLLVTSGATFFTPDDRVSGAAVRRLVFTASGDIAPTATLIGAGDICVASRVRVAHATSDLVAIEADAHVFTLGDNSNEMGTAAQYVQCYGLTWGRFINRTSPAVGNHDYYADGAESYFTYFGEAAGPRGKGYYSYDLEGWHIIVLNAECAAVGGCGHCSPQDQWLAADLAAHPTTCTLAYWHQPRLAPELQVRAVI